jgi:hypothetical protein
VTTSPPDTSPVTTAAPPDGGGGGGTGGAGEEPDGVGAATFTRPPMWPFRSAAEVEDWHDAYSADGTDAWHLDARDTALRFTRDFLGFGEIDQVVTSDVGADDAYVTVGYVPEPGAQPSAAANIHLRRFGTTDEAPWEVVGTEDTSLTLETPAYGSAPTSPLTVGGVVSGVDESLRVQVRQPSSAGVLGESCCVPAGGEQTPWTATVEIAGGSDPALTVVVSTGGHVQDVERFAITALRT